MMAMVAVHDVVDVDEVAVAADYEIGVRSHHHGVDAVGEHLLRDGEPTMMAQMPQIPSRSRTLPSQLLLLLLLLPPPPAAAAEAEEEPAVGRTV
jgi:hypothetical protein